MLNRPAWQVALSLPRLRSTVRHYRPKRSRFFSRISKAAVQRHDAIGRAAMDAHGGYVFMTVGDAFCVAFARSDAAVAAALDFQRALASEDFTAGLSLPAEGDALEDLVKAIEYWQTSSRARPVSSWRSFAAVRGPSGSRRCGTDDVPASVTRRR